MVAVAIGAWFHALYWCAETYVEFEVFRILIEIKPVLLDGW